MISEAKKMILKLDGPSGVDLKEFSIDGVAIPPEWFITRVNIEITARDLTRVIIECMPMGGLEIDSGVLPEGVVINNYAVKND